MGPCHLTRQVSPDASVHAVHVRRRCSNLQHGDRVHANVQPVQERSCNQHRYVSPKHPTGKTRPRNPLIERLHSIRALCSVILVPQIVQHSFRSKDLIYPYQYDDARAGAVQMQLDGSATDGNRGLAGVRDSETGT